MLGITKNFDILAWWTSQNPPIIGHHMKHNKKENRKENRTWGDQTETHVIKRNTT